ncbi:MAG: hypothetical protein AMXMBFR64_46770 [Myxococcales bacterium]
MQRLAVTLVALVALVGCGTDPQVTIANDGSGGSPYGGNDGGVETGLDTADFEAGDASALEDAAGSGDGGSVDAGTGDAGKEDAGATTTDAAQDTGAATNDAGVDAAPDAPQDAQDAPAPWCGDGTCDAGEACGDCATDCGVCPDPCGDGACDTGAGEGCATCPKDCGACPDPCGDGTCDAAKGETCATCAPDCGACPIPCGDGTCAPSESCVTCVADCGACPSPCGDGSCKGTDGETCSTCPADCGACPKCGDGTCNPGETCGSCPGDCGACPPECGDGACDAAESCSSCPGDCGTCVPTCGDGACNGAEACDSCPGDCGACPPKCGDGQCNGEESCASCTGDCGPCAATCGDASCSPDEGCQSCPQDCGACPPAIVFQDDWKEVLTGAPAQGGFLRIAYDIDRLPECRGVKSGLPAWTVEVFYTWDLSQPAAKVPVIAVNGQTGQVEVVEPTIPVPPGATDIWLWAHNVDVLGCETWDSDFENNYRFPVFEKAALAQPVGWAGNFHMVESTNGANAFLGDVDPAWYFATMAGEGKTTWVQTEVWVPGITDRTYQNADVTAQVAAVAVVAIVRTDATAGGTPGGAMVEVPLQYVGKAGNNFVYRWAPASLVGTVPLVPNGAYRYRFELRTPGGEVTGIGKPGANDDPRRYVLATFADCTLFPYDPPGFCQ